jgi:hypothetical protein
MTNIEKGIISEVSKRKVRHVLWSEALRNLRLAFSAGINMGPNTSGGPLELDWAKIEEVGKRGVTPSMPKPYGA